MLAEFISVFVPVSLAVNLYPGPNNIFALSNAARWGVGAAVVASLGRHLAFGGLVAALAFGLGALVLLSPGVFLVLRLLGAAFLLWLGLKMLLRHPATLAIAPGVIAPDRRRMFLDEFTVAFANPKPLIVLLPFLPSLVAPDRAVSVGVLLAGALFLSLEAAAALIYALAGRHFATIATEPAGRLWLDRAGALSVILAGVLLAATALRD